MVVMVRAMPLRLQLLLLQALIVCAIVVSTGLVAGWLQERMLRDAYLDRIIGVAQSVANLPTIEEAFDSPAPSAVVQPIAEVIREASDVTYVVVTDAAGIRLSHPDPERIGERVSTDPSVPLDGEIWVGTQTGTLGESWRAKVPVFGTGGEVIGSVSVGILESELRDDLRNDDRWLLLALCAAAVLGILGAAAVSAVVRRRILGLEPREIASLVGSQETMLHGMSEGVVTVDDTGRIALVNDAALELLGLERSLLDGDGHPLARDVLDPSLVDVLENGEPDGRLVLSGVRVLVARSTGSRVDGRPVGAALLIRDHTELHGLLRAMDGAQSLTDGLRAQAHEFANSMHVVSGLLELGAVGDARDFIDRLGTGGALSVGVSATGPVLDDPGLTALLMVKGSQARERDVDLVVESSEGVPDALAGLSTAGRDDLVTVVGNLVDNALEACSGGSHRVRLALAVSGAAADGGPAAVPRPAELVVTVEDDGPGIPPDQYERVFEVGVSTKAVAAGPDPSGGSTSAPASGSASPETDDAPRLKRRGIGLALVRRVVVRSGGSVGVSRSALGGACLTVRVPLARASDRLPAGV
jgi:two-component system CitB family sensor kinase